MNGKFGKILPVGRDDRLIAKEGAKEGANLKGANSLGGELNDIRFIYNIARVLALSNSPRELMALKY